MYRHMSYLSRSTDEHQYAAAAPQQAIAAQLERHTRDQASFL
jgi:hypothetical protein